MLLSSSLKLLYYSILFHKCLIHYNYLFIIFSSNIIEFRKANLKAFQEKHGLRFSFMSVFLKAAAYALQDQPVVNAVIDGTDIVYRDYVDISVAVATPKGLVVPVVRNVERMTYADIELSISHLAEKARKGNFSR